MRSIFVLGDSISIQYGPYLTKALAGQVQVRRKTGVDKALENLDVAQGANGGDSNNCRLYLQAALNTGEAKADLLLLNCGLHDVKCKPNQRQRQVSAEQYEANLNAMLDMVASRKQPVAWIRTTSICESQHNVPAETIWRYNEDVDAYNKISDRVMAARQIPIIDLPAFTATLGKPCEVISDGRHFLPAVQEKQGVHIAGWVLGWFAGR